MARSAIDQEATLRITRTFAAASTSSLRSPRAAIMHQRGSDEYECDRIHSTVPVQRIQKPMNREV